MSLQRLQRVSALSYITSPLRLTSITRSISSSAAAVSSSSAFLRNHAATAPSTPSFCGARNCQRMIVPSVGLFRSRSFARYFSTSPINQSSTTVAVESSPASSKSGEIPVMAHYVNPTMFDSLALPAFQASRAYRFTQPNSVMIPLDMTASAQAGGQAVSRILLSTLLTLPPVPVAPIVRVPGASSTPASSSSVLPSSSSLAFDAQSPFMIVFAYGAIVFFNVPEAMQQEILRSNSIGFDLSTAKLKDEYKILLRGRTNEAFSSCRFLTDSVEVHGMDMNSIRIVSQILSQAVAMQHYEGEANRLLLKLRAMMRPSELRKGVPTLHSSRSDLIVRYVAESSTAMIDVLTELKLLDRSEIVWGSGQYDQLWSGLRREFDLTDRWEALQTKLDLLRDSHPFFLQVVHQMQSHRMEIIIIVLIAIEVILSIVFHSPLIPWIKEQLGIKEDEEESKPKAIKH